MLKLNTRLPHAALPGAYWRRSRKRRDLLVQQARRVPGGRDLSTYASRSCCNGAVRRFASAFAGLVLMLAIWASLPVRAHAAESSATYRVTFAGTWTTAATPGGLPSGAHFSPLIGAVHNGNVIFWRTGEAASPGIEAVAELGRTGTFKSEINASEYAIATVEKSFRGGGTPSADVDFEVTADHPLVTLITMIAPSPDWFVGVSGLSLLDDAGQWRVRLEVDLYPYDAGTEDGEGFSLSNPATNPHGVITSIRGMGKFASAPMANLTFVCQSGCTPPPPPTPDPTPVQGVPLFPSASDPDGREGFVRVINRSGEAREVQVIAIDDMGLRSDPLTLSVAGGETVHFNSNDLEMGNENKGLSGGTGARPGDSRLELTTQTDIEVLSYIRNADGFLTAMHDIVPGEDNNYRVALFNPGKNDKQKSLLRLINPGAQEAMVTIRSIDDTGKEFEGSVSVTLPGGGARTFSAAALESSAGRGDLEEDQQGDAALEGELGMGTGKWRLIVTSEQPVLVMSLLESPTGHLTNLSTAPTRRALGMTAGAESGG